MKKGLKKFNYYGTALYAKSLNDLLIDFEIDDFGGSAEVTITDEEGNEATDSFCLEGVVENAVMDALERENKKKVKKSTKSQK